MARSRLRVTGTVQGVGFRPFVYRHAVALGLVGFVRNDSDGVLVEVEGGREAIAELARVIAGDPPPLARVAGVHQEPRPVRGDERDFRIDASDAGGLPAVPVGIDSAPCADCLADIADPANRRHRYPFTNCTNCGPRYTIVRSVPYDRPATTMAAFAMCDDCRREYHDPADRRFHAQPNACPACGPRLAYLDPAGNVLAKDDDALAAAVTALRAGGVVAVKGVGGYHLAVDATDDGAVAELRRRKARDDKPFAVMAADVDDAARLCILDDGAVAALTSVQRPIVIAPRRAGARVASGVAPGSGELGVFLPYSPLHHLLLAGVGRPIVLTSGNLSDEPIAHEDDDARERLGPLVDGLLVHDRPIHIRCDDSVARATAAGVQLLRRSRGHAPEPMPLPVTVARPVLAVGAELKSTVSVARDAWVVASHHIGDLEHLATYRSFEQAVGHLCHLYGVAPEVVACDLHPEYLSTKFALDLDLPAVGVQHHHAHVAACMVEHARTEPVLGVAFDGIGYGLDGTLWGGEFLVADLVGARRVAHLRPIVLPGGAAAIREPWRTAVAWTRLAVGDDVALTRFQPIDERAGAVLDLARRGPAPVTTSVGRLFDAVAVLLGCRARVTYEAQAAIELETLARAAWHDEAPAFEGLLRVERDVVSGVAVLDPAPLVNALLDAHDAGVSPALLAAAFHRAFGQGVAFLAAELASANGLHAAILTGGVFQNALLSDVVAGALRDAGVHVLRHRVVPPNDAGISIGQAAVAAATVGNPPIYAPAHRT